MKRSHRQSVRMNASICELSGWNGSFDKLPPNKTYTLIIDYPIDDEARFDIQTGKSGMGLAALLRKIGQTYERVYRGHRKYGIWGHGIYDLGLGEIIVNHQKRTIRLVVSS